MIYLNDDWKVALMVALMVIAIAGCTAVGMVSGDKAKIEIEKLKYEYEIK